MTIVFRNRLVLITLLLIQTIIAKGAESDSTNHKLKAAANISLNSNGIASIPAFSLDKPAIIATLSLAKNRFSYEPVLGYSLEMKPWFIDNWLNYKIVNRTKFELRAGVNFSTFFTPVKISDTAILKAERYFAYTITGVYKFTPATFLTLAYWSDNGQEPNTISGHFFNFIIEKNDFHLGNHGLLAIALQVFYIDYDGNNDGLFFTPRIAASVKDLPLSVYFQATQGIYSNIEPFPEFKWNVGVAWYF
jgi:hypothetical protein